MTEIRTFAESDRTELRDLFGRAGEGAPPLWGDEESEAAIYLNPYMDLKPDSLVAAVADGALVGYLTGCLDSFKFPRESERIEQAIELYSDACRQLLDDPAGRECSSAVARPFTGCGSLASVLLPSMRRPRRRQVSKVSGPADYPGRTVRWLARPSGRPARQPLPGRTRLHRDCRSGTGCTCPGHSAGSPESAEVR